MKRHTWNIAGVMQVICKFQTLATSRQITYERSTARQTHDQNEEMMSPIAAAVMRAAHVHPKIASHHDDCGHRYGCREERDRTPVCMRNKRRSPQRFFCDTFRRRARMWMFRYQFFIWEFQHFSLSLGFAKAKADAETTL
jgi:hypothetical protein